MTTTVETTLPGIGQYKTQIPVKVTNMQLMSGPFGTMMNFSDDLLQAELQRGS